MSDINNALGVNSKDEQTQQKVVFQRTTLPAENTVASVLKSIGYLVFIAGLILGLVFANISVPTGIGTIFESTKDEFSWTIAFTWWGTALISGLVFIGFAEIINLLQGIKNNLEYVRKGLSSKNL